MTTQRLWYNTHCPLRWLFMPCKVRAAPTRRSYKMHANSHQRGTCGVRCLCGDLCTCRSFDGRDWNISGSDPGCVQRLWDAYGPPLVDKNVTGEAWQTPHSLSVDRQMDQGYHVSASLLAGSSSSGRGSSGAARASAHSTRLVNTRHLDVSLKQP